MPELERLARTIAHWETPILRWHRTRLTNTTTEGTNLIIKNIKRLGYGFRNSDNYHLRLLLRCGAPWQHPQVASIQPQKLRDGGRLGLVLFQLPRYVYPSRASFGYLEWVANELEGIRLAVEFRQRRWMDDEHREATIGFLAEHDLVYVCVDEPAGLASTLPPVAVATTDVAEVRFHGRNAALWEAPGVPPAERHRYDYRREELAEWVPKIRQLHNGGRPVHVLMNNCADGACVRNAADARPAPGRPTRSRRLRQGHQPQLPRVATRIALIVWSRFSA